MDNDTDSPLDETASLRTHPVPSATLEPRVVDALRREGLIRRAPVSTFSTPAKIAASLLIFVAGAVAGRYVLPDRVVAPQAAPAQPRYLLLLAGDVTPSPDGSTRAEEYGNWANSLAARGISVSGEELGAHSEVVSNAKGSAFPDLVTVGGYFLIEANDDASAAALARTCPHIKYGGSIIVRRVQ